MGVFGDINKAEIMGNITQDLDLRYTANGTAVVNFSVATNRNFRQGEEWQEEVSFHNIVVWSKDAEALSQRAKKGTRVYIQGRLQTRNWEDSDGKKNYRTEIVAEKVILLDRYEKGEMDAPSAPKSNSDELKSSTKGSAKKAAPQDEDIIDPDDLPF